MPSCNILLAVVAGLLAMAGAIGVHHSPLESEDHQDAAHYSSILTVRRSCPPRIALPRGSDLSSKKPADVFMPVSGKGRNSFVQPESSLLTLNCLFTV